MAGLMDCDVEENLEKELSENLKVFNKKFEITALKDKLKIVGSCKKCEKKLQEIGNLLKLHQILLVTVDYVLQ